MAVSRQSLDISSKKSKAEEKLRILMPQTLSNPLVIRFKRKPDLLVRGQKQEGKVSLPSLYTLMNHLAGKQPAPKLREDCTPADITKKSLGKRLQPLPLSSLHMSRSSLKLPKAPAAPEITLSLVEPADQSTQSLKKKASCSFLQLPHSIRTPSESDGSPCSECSDSFSSVADSVMASPVTHSRDFNDSEVMLRAGIWHPWAAHLTPCHQLLDMRPPKNPRIHRYLRKLPKLERKHVTSDSVNMHTCSLSHAPDVAIECTCDHSFHPRNLKLLLSREVDPVQLAHAFKTSCGLQQLIKPGVIDPSTPILLVHLEGVIMDISKPCMFDRRPVVFSLRPGLVEGLKVLSKSFALVFLSDSAVYRFYKLLEFLIQKRVHICAAYILRIEAENVYHERISINFQDYSRIFLDLGIKESSSKRMLLLTALHCDPSQSFFSQTGLRVRFNALHLPTVLPGKGHPIVTVLVPHMRLSDTALHFTHIAREILRVFSVSAAYGGLEDAYLARATQDKSKLVRYVTTKKVHEAYYAYLLSEMPWQEVKHTAESRFRLHCAAHPDSHFIARLLPESHFILISSESPDKQASCEVLDLESCSTKGKYSSLLEFVQSMEDSV